MKAVGRGAGVIAVAAMLSAAPALAHTGAGVATGFAAGFAHPLLGLDHVLAMVAVGLWAGTMKGRALWLVPGAFVTAMMAGGVLGLVGVAVPAVELGIAASVAVLGLLLAFNPALPLAAAMAAAALFAVFHGHAHGSEMPAGAAWLGYGLGFTLATALLHGLGIAAAASLRWRGATRLMRMTGAAVSLAGFALMAG